MKKFLIVSLILTISLAQADMCCSDYPGESTECSCDTNRGCCGCKTCCCCSQPDYVGEQGTCSSDCRCESVEYGCVTQVAASDEPVFDSPVEQQLALLRWQQLCVEMCAIATRDLKNLNEPLCFSAPVHERAVIDERVRAHLPEIQKLAADSLRACAQMCAVATNAKIMHDIVQSQEWKSMRASFEMCAQAIDQFVNLGDTPVIARKFGAALTIYHQMFDLLERRLDESSSDSLLPFIQKHTEDAREILLMIAHTLSYDRLVEAMDVLSHVQSLKVHAKFVC